MIREPSHIMSDDFMDIPGDDFKKIDFYIGDEEKLIEVSEWADKNCKAAWFIGWRYSAFYNEEDAILFSLRWIENDN